MFKNIKAAVATIIISIAASIGYGWYSDISSAPTTNAVQQVQIEAIQKSINSLDALNNRITEAEKEQIRGEGRDQVTNTLLKSISDDVSLLKTEYTGLDTRVTQLEKSSS